MNKQKYYVVAGVPLPESTPERGNLMSCKHWVGIPEAVAGLSDSILIMPFTSKKTNRRCYNEVLFEPDKENNLKYSSKLLLNHAQTINDIDLWYKVKIKGTFEVESLSNIYLNMTNNKQSNVGKIAKHNIKDEFYVILAESGSVKTTLEIMNFNSLSNRAVANFKINAYDDGNLEIYGNYLINEQSVKSIKKEVLGNFKNDIEIILINK